MVLLLVANAVAGCELSDLDATMQSAEAAFIDMSDDFDPLRKTLDAGVDCLTEPLDPKRAGQLHRTRALYRFFDDDNDGTRAHFARYRALEPGAELPDALAPRDNPLRKLFDKADDAGDSRPLAKPASGWLLVDGVQAQTAPAALPFVLQHLDDDGSVKLTASVAGEATLPRYPVAPGTVVEPKPRPTTRNRFGPFTVAGLGVMGAGLVSYGAAFGTRGAYKSAVADGDRERIQRQHTTTNALSIAGVGMIGAGTGLVIKGVL